MVLVSAGVPASPLPPPLNAAAGSFDLVVDEGGQQASWSLQLCGVPQYISSHLHVVRLCLALMQPFGSLGEHNAWTKTALEVSG